MKQSRCYYIKRGQVVEGLVLSGLQPDKTFLVLSNSVEITVHQNNMILIEDFPEDESWNKQSNPRPRYSYSKEEFQVLWNYDRGNVANLTDIFRYFQQQSKGFLEIYWDFMLSELNLWLTKTELDLAWIKAVEMNIKNYAQLNDLSHYKKGEAVAFHVLGQTIIFTNHAVERTFERLNIQRENFRSLVYTMLQDSVPLKTKKRTSDRDTFLYNDMFNWTFVLQKGSFEDTYRVKTCYEPSIHWRRFEVVEDSPLYQEEIEEAS